MAGPWQHHQASQLSLGLERPRAPGQLAPRSGWILAGMLPAKYPNQQAKYLFPLAIKKELTHMHWE